MKSSNNNNNGKDPFANLRTMTNEGMIKIVYELLEDKLNISKITFTSGGNIATEEYKIDKTIERCPLCGIALTNGICTKCGYKKA